MGSNSWRVLRPWGSSLQGDEAGEEGEEEEMEELQEEV